VEIITHSIGRCLRRTHRSKDTLEAKTTCAPLLFICVVRYGSIFLWMGFSLRSRELPSPVPSKRSSCLVGSPIPAGNVVVYPGLYIILRLSLADGKLFDSGQAHETHSCSVRLCPLTCELCNRLCVGPHLHALTPRTNHLCGLVLSPLLRVIVTEDRNEQRNAQMFNAMLCSGNLSDRRETSIHAGHLHWPT
jgi:hypothetical protein